MRLLTVLAATFLAGSAFAQPDTAPVLSVPEDTITMSAGQAQKLHFPTTFDRVDITTDAIVRVNPLSDRVMTLHGLAAGETILTVFAGTKELYSALIVVSAEAGHLVKIYGTGKNDDANAGHTAVFCNAFGCGRPDKDLPRPTITVDRISRGPKDK